MKSRLINSITAIATLAILICFAGVSDSAAQQNKGAQAMFNEGIKLFKANEFEKALVKFETVLKLSPSSLYARSYVGKCKQGISKGGRNKNVLKAQLEQLRIPKISLTETPIGDVMDYLAQRAEELSGNKIALNFIYKGTQEQRDNTLVTLNLRNVPISQVIQYVGQMTRTTFKYEEHAVIADPNGRKTVQNIPATPSAKENNKPFGKEPSKGPFDQ